jgi:UTP---glucose-1-phosphate uridylyltransferase
MQSIEAIENLARHLKSAKTLPDRIAILDREPLVAEFLRSKHTLCSLLSSLSPEKEAALKQLIAIGQAPLYESNISAADLFDLAERLAAIDDFYRELGGIAGYQLQILQLIDKKEARSSAEYHSPFFFDITEPKSVESAIEEGVLAQPLLSEMYPLGGAADRLHLIDEKTGSELPAAKLEFAGRTLLEWLLRDLEAREYFYYQRTGQAVTTPVAVMTSHEKDNYLHVQDILEKNQWFGRPRESFRLFVQPLVPAVNQHGEWRWTQPWKMLLKPGGHGAIWKLAKDKGVFDWLKTFGVKYALIRQINNPLAGLDHGLLALAGIGVSRRMSFGFASCPRLCLSAEGMNVLIERKTPKGYSYVISNIEYCDFEKVGIEDRPLHPDEPYSRFTSNTNILFADLAQLEGAVDRCPFPGLMINLKKGAGEEMIGRLESAMQNIADAFAEERKTRSTLQSGSLKKTFATYNVRHKTISTAKKAYAAGRPLTETPENCFYDLMRAHRDLLSAYCQFSLPEDRTLEEVLSSHPPFVFLFHPALGPVFEMIGQKIRRGRLGMGSECILEIAKADIENLEVDGSLQVLAQHPLGRPRFSFFPKCVLKNVKVSNRGVDWALSQPFWKGRYQRSESLVIVLEGNSEFIAENVVLEGDRRYVVRDNERLIVSVEGKCIRESLE